MFKFLKKDNKKIFWSLSVGAIALAYILVYYPALVPQAMGSYFNSQYSSFDTGCGGTVSISKNASGSGTSPSGTISITVSTTNACTGVYWRIYLVATAGSTTYFSNWIYGSGTGRSQTFNFSNLSAGDYTVSGDAYIQYWNGTGYKDWVILSTTNGTITISNPPPPPPPPPPPAPNTPSLSGPTQAYYGNTANYSWSAASGATYYLFGYQYKDANNNTISSISPSSMEYIGNTTSKSLTVTASTSAKKLYGILVACGGGGCGSFSNSIEANLYEMPTASNVTADIKARITGTGDTGYGGIGPRGGISVPNNTSIDVGWGCTVPVGSPTYVLVYQEGGIFNSSQPSSPGTTVGTFTSPVGQNTLYRFQEQCGTNPVTVANDPNTLAVDYVDVTVQAPTLDVSMSHSASPSSHTLSGGQVVTTSSVVVGGTATGNISYSFNCNNGSPVQTAAPFSCTYTSAGTYNPNVTVTRGGMSASTNEFVTIYSTPTVDIKANGSNGPVSLITGQSANLTWTSSNASSCTSSGPWGNFGKSLNNTNGESTGALSSGTYTYTLTCSNSGGSGTSDSVTINVTSPPLLRAPSSGLGGCQGTPSTANTFSDVTWTATWEGGLAPYSYKWSGPGTSSTNSTSASRLTTYASTGSKSETIRITSNDGQTLDMSCGSVQIYYPPVTGSCSANKSSVSTGEPVTWSTASVSGGSGSYSYSWSGTDNLSGNQSSISKTYSTSGSKGAATRITSGQTQDYANSINYIDIPCAVPGGGTWISVSYPAVDVTCYPNISTAYPGQTVNWAVNYVSGGSGSYTYSWSGSESLSCSGQPSGSCNNVNKSYSQNGTKTASVTAYSGGLNKTQQCANSVNIVSTPDPTASINAVNTTINYRDDARITWSSTNTSSCSVSPTGWSGTSGSRTDNNLTTSKTYRVTCNGLNEKSSTQVSAEVRVKVSPSVSCSVSPTSVAVGNQVTWRVDSASGGDGNYSYSWSGDESLSGNSASVTKTYSLAGGKNGTVTVTSDGIDSICSPISGNDITVYSSMAVSCSASPLATTVNNNITGSTTPSGGKTPYRYSWSGSDGLKGTGSSEQQSYTSVGTKNGTVTVTSDDNQTKSCSATATISNKPSISSFTVNNSSIIQGESTTLSWTCADSTTSSGSGFNTGGATSGSATVSPNSTTTYSLTCSNSINETASASQNITVAPQSLSTAISVSPASGTTPLNVTITATPTSVSPAGNKYNYSFWKDCNNNSTNVGTANNACGTLPTPTWGTCASNSVGTKCDGVSDNPKSVVLTYSSAGTFNPKVIVERGILAAQANNKTVTTYSPLSASCSASPTSTTVNNSVTWSATNASGGSGTYTYSWSGTNGLNGNTSSVTKSYTNTGTKTGTVTISSPGVSNISCAPSSSVTISNKPSVSSFTVNNSSIIQGESTTLRWTCADSTTSSGTSFNTGGQTSGSASITPNSTTSYTVTCSNSIGENSSSAPQTVTVTPQSINVSLSASPSSGRAPLSSSLTASVTGTAPAGTSINYSFWWNCNYSDPNASVSNTVGQCGSLPSPVPGTCQVNSTGAKCDGMSSASQAVSNTYPNAGNYKPKVIAERGLAPAKETIISLPVDDPALTGGGGGCGGPGTQTSAANSPVVFSACGGNGSYSWSTSSAQCSPTSGSGSTFTVSCSQAGSHTITVTSGAQSLDMTLITASTILSFNANPAALNPGQSTTLSWLATGYANCSIDQGIGNVNKDGGSKTIFYKQDAANTNKQFTYTLTCLKPGGGSDSSQTTVSLSKIPKLREVLPR